MKKHHAVFLMALLLRILSTIVTTITDLNPESDADATTFASWAARAAVELRAGNLIVDNIWLIDPLWGTLLSPYWLLPGPSPFYGRIGNALLGALAIYNVYVIARHFHSHRAGVIAVLPMIFLPSFVAIHSTLLRAALILFCITSAARLAFVPGLLDVRWKRYVLIVPVLALATLLRPENAWLFGAALVAGVATHLLRTYRLAIPIGYGAAGLFLAGALWKRTQINRELLSLVETRKLRAIGRTKYLPTVLPDSFLEALAFSWIGAIYFLFSPFPWMIGSPVDLLLGVESAINLIFAVAAIAGVRRLGRKAPAVTAALLMALVLGSILYGLGEANVGTAMRHRQQLLWILYLFGGITIASRFEFALGIGRPVGGFTTGNAQTTAGGGQDDPQL